MLFSIIVSKICEQMQDFGPADRKNSLYLCQLEVAAAPGADSAWFSALSRC